MAGATLPTEVVASYKLIWSPFSKVMEAVNTSTQQQKTSIRCHKYNGYKKKVANNQPFPKHPELKLLKKYCTDHIKRSFGHKRFLHKGLRKKCVILVG